MSRELRFCPGVGSRKCGAFLSSWDRNPHPTCTSCRGRICTRDMTCDFCAGWSPSQWEAFAKKRAYEDRKRSSRPSGSLPPAAVTSPRAGTSSEVLRPWASSSSSSLPSGGQAKREGLRMHLVLRPVRLPLLPLDLGPARGVKVSLVARPVRTSALLPPRLLRELGRGKLLVCSGLPLPALLPRLPLPTHHSTLCDVVSRESLRWSAPILDPPVFSDLRIEEQGRIAGPALGRPALVTGPVVLALALLTARGRERRRRASSRSLSSREQSRLDRSGSSDRFWSRRICSRSQGGRSRSSDRYRSRRDRFRRDRSRSSDRYRSRRQRSRSHARRGGRRHRSRSRDPPRRSRDRSRSKEGGRRARREKQEGAETVAASQDPAVSGASAAVVPPVGGATRAALPSAVQDLARFFLNLAGSSSLGAVGGVAGVAAPASGVGVLAVPSGSQWRSSRTLCCNCGSC